MDFHKVIYNFMMYGFNYDHDFVRKIFGSHYDEYLIRHLEHKFESAYESEAGHYGAFFLFWSELDTDKKHILEDWIMDNYRG